MLTVEPWISKRKSTLKAQIKNFWCPQVVLEFYKSPCDMYALQVVGRPKIVFTSLPRFQNKNFTECQQHVIAPVVIGTFKSKRWTEKMGVYLDTQYNTAT